MSNARRLKSKTVLLPRAHCFRIELQLEIFEAHFEWAAGVELKGDDPAPGAVGVVEIDAGFSVDEGLHVAADGDDFVFVPVVGADMPFARLFPEQLAAVLFVELAPPADSHVGL